MDCHIPPPRIDLGDQLIFPIPAPAFELPLAVHCRGKIVVKLEPDKCFDIVFARMAGDDTGAVLLDPQAQVVCFADIEGTVGARGHNVDEIRHGFGMARYG